MFPDAFLSHLDAPMLSLEYTSNYAYIESISKELNKLITNFKEESSFGRMLKIMWIWKI